MKAGQVMIGLASGGLLMASALAVAGERVGDSGAQPPEFRAAAWLELQRSNQQASAIAQTATDLERDKAIERFLKTYDYAIPERYQGNTFRVK